MALLFLAILSLSCAARPARQGWASCFGDYSKNTVSNGLESFIHGEDFTWTTAMCGFNRANHATGSCYAITCKGAKSAGLRCLNEKPTYARVIDRLGNECNPTSGKYNHVFNLNKVPFNQIAFGGASCNGSVHVDYRAVDCEEAGLASGGIKIGLAPKQVDPWCPSFFFSNIGHSGALYSVEVSTNGGLTWSSFKHSSVNGARWDCTSGSGGYLGKALTFRLISCDLNGLPDVCTPGKTLTIENALPANWCSSESAPCPAASFKASVNFPSESSLRSAVVPNANQARFVIYVDGFTAWYPPSAIAAGLGIPGYAKAHGYNVINLAFWTSSGTSVDAAAVWANPLQYVSTDNPWGKTNDAIQKAWVAAYHSQGIKVLVSAFGSTDFPTSGHRDPIATAKALATFVKTNNLDGVDLDWEDNDAMNIGTGEAWIINCTLTLRQLLPPPYLISHAPQAPYFTGTSTYKNGGYLAVDARAGSSIDFYNVQFYNQGTSMYQTYQTLFQVSDGWATNTAVAQMVASKIPREKIVVGKGVQRKDVVNTGFVEQAALKAMLAQGVQAGYAAGFMGWQYDSDTTNWGTDLASVFPNNTIN